MRRFQKWFPYIIGSILVLLGFYVFCRGLLIAGENGWGGSGFFKKLPGKDRGVGGGYIQRSVDLGDGDRNRGKIWKKKKSVGRKVVDVLFPPLEETEEEGEKTGDLLTEEQGETGAGGADSQRLSETEADEKMNGSKVVESIDSSGADYETETEPDTALPYVSAFSNSAIPTPAAESLRQAPQVLPWADMKDFNFLLNQYFILDASAAIDESLLNVDNLMEKDLAIDTDTDGPQILIYHTHSQEAFADSRPGDLRDTIIGVGERLKEILTDQYGFEVLHHTKVYDMIDGKLDRNKAYNLAAPDIEAILKAYPSIQVVIDLHRDGVDDYRFVTEFNGKPVAKIMFYNGLSRTARNGPVIICQILSIADNLAFSFSSR